MPFSIRKGSNEGARGRSKGARGSTRKHEVTALIVATYTMLQGNYTLVSLPSLLSIKLALLLARIGAANVISSWRHSHSLPSYQTGSSLSPHWSRKRDFLAEAFPLVEQSRARRISRVVAPECFSIVYIIALFLKWTDLEDAVVRLLYSEKEESAH